MDSVLLQSLCGRDSVTLEALAATTAGAVVCGIWHEVGSAPCLPARIHANTFASLNFVLEGSVSLAACGTPLSAPFVTGPLTRPLDTLIRAPARSLCLVIQPWLLRDWFGLEPRTMVDQVRALDPTHPAPQWLPGLHHAIGNAQPGSAALGTALARAGTPHAVAPARYSTALDGHRRVASAARACEISERQFHREFIRHFGLPPGRWLKMRRFEQALVELAVPPTEAQISLAHAAASAGYADHAHMTRAFGELCGVSPSAARSALDTGSIEHAAISAARLWRSD